MNYLIEDKLQEFRWLESDRRCSSLPRDMDAAAVGTSGIPQSPWTTGGSTTYNSASSTSSSKYKNGHQLSDHLCKQSRRQGTPGLVLCTRLLEIKWQHQGLSFHQFPLTLFIPNFIAKLRRLGFQDSYWSNSPFLTTLCGSQLSTQNMFGLLIHPNFFRN